ncbi:MAG: glycosyltransferase [Chitinophagaceae bacterium]|nr:glycosyltransferase [Chitinophagaceae bacterium]
MNGEQAAALPAVAVLMATYNGEKYIVPQLDSILNQHGVSVQLYIRDDHSTDGTIAIINEYRQRYPNVFLLPAAAGQLRVTKNFYSIVRDIDLETADYMGYADQDDIWLPEKLATAIAAMKANNADCYASNLLRGDADGNIIRNNSLLSRFTDYVLNDKTNHHRRFDHYFEAASAGCTLVLGKTAALYFQQRIRKIYERVPVDASHDWSTYAITRLHGFRWFIDRASYIIYRQHSQNAYGANTGMSGISKLTDLFRSGWYRRHILMIEDLYNEDDIHPAFIKAVREFRHSSFLSRLRVAFAICPHRRKWVHRLMLFFLVTFGYFK